MKRNELEAFIMETYNAVADYPWRKSPRTRILSGISHEQGQLDHRRLGRQRIG